MKHRSVRRRAAIITTFIALGAIIACTLAIGGRPNGRRVSVVGLRAPLRTNNIVRASTATTNRIYPYSVIPGGVRSRQELADAIGRDPVVAAHYRSLSTGAVRTEVVKEDRLAYMSYRIGDKIYWTKNKLLLKKGETILTDGVTQVRSRCGNCISMQPMGPASDNEPDPIQFEALTAPAAVIPAAEPEPAGIGPGTIVANELISGPQDLFALGAGGMSGGGATPGVGIVPGILPGSGDTPSVPGNTGFPGFNPAVTDLGVPPITLPPGGGGNPPQGPPTTPPTTPTVPPIVELPPPVVTVNPPPPVENVPVPEPGTLLLVSGGVATMLARRKKA